jgi:hypothetical protein
LTPETPVKETTKLNWRFRCHNLAGSHVKFVSKLTFFLSILTG